MDVSGRVQREVDEKSAEADMREEREKEEQRSEREEGERDRALNLKGEKEGDRTPPGFSATVLVRSLSRFHDIICSDAPQLNRMVHSSRQNGSPIEIEVLWRGAKQTDGFKVQDVTGLLHSRLRRDDPPHHQK